MLFALGSDSAVDDSAGRGRYWPGQRQVSPAEARWEGQTSGMIIQMYFLQ